MGPGGYCWWYADGVSDDGQFGLTIIAFIGSVFSPYYAWSGRRDPLNHCAVNVALYGPRGRRWAMTERGRAALSRDRDHLTIGPSALAWDGDALTISVNEICAPLPRGLRGSVHLTPTAIHSQSFDLDSRGRHVWRPIAPVAHIAAKFDAPNLSWSGHGYFDMNFGAEPLEKGFRDWTWSRAALRDGAAISYEANRRNDGPMCMALRFLSNGSLQSMEPPPLAALPSSRWRIARQTRADHGGAHIDHTLEDTPFYARSLLSSQIFGERVIAMHESLSLDRFANPVVQAMLPFKMPRAILS